VDKPESGGTSSWFDTPNVAPTDRDARPIALRGVPWCSEAPQGREAAFLRLQTRKKVYLKATGEVLPFRIWDSLRGMQ
jgi:hypothetical protein